MRETLTDYFGRLHKNKNCAFPLKTKQQQQFSFELIGAVVRMCSVKGVLRKTSACNFIKKDTLAQVFSGEFCKISKNTSGGCFWIKHIKRKRKKGSQNDVNYSVIKKSIVGGNSKKNPYYALWKEGHVRWR